MNLRELTQDQKDILDLVENGELSLDDVNDHLTMLTQERNIKIENCLYVIGGLQSSCDSVDAEIARLMEISKARKSKIDNVKNWLVVNMEDGEKHDFDLYKVTKVKGRDICNITDAESIPEDYMTHKPETWSPDKRKILAELKEGKEIAGAEMVKGKSSLRIK